MNSLITPIRHYLRFFCFVAMVALASLVNAADYFMDAVGIIDKYPGNPSRAEREIQPLLGKIDKWQSAVIYSALGEAYNKVGSYQEAIQSFRICNSLSSGPCNRTSFAFAYLNAKDYYQALEIGRRLTTKENPAHSIGAYEFANGYYVMGTSYYGLGQKSEACTYWRKSYSSLTDYQRSTDGGSQARKSGEKLREFCG